MRRLPERPAEAGPAAEDRPPHCTAADPPHHREHPMIRTVATQIAARVGPAYVGRHRRARPVLHRVLGLVGAAPADAPLEEAVR
ncbi:hypothetical protein ACFQS3_12815 [Glycomyces mayteni]|uniref:Uncharacterized protein n=1 Tax=Glycomyces mayteni TaxID=543887 RepID=A0ABW2DAV2_9ACTN